MAELTALQRVGLGCTLCLVMYNIVWSGQLQNPSLTFVSSIDEVGWSPSSMDFDVANQLNGTKQQRETNIVYSSLPNEIIFRTLTDRKVVLVHVGKTGGETVRNTLKITCRIRQNPRRRQECQDRFDAMMKESLLSQHSIGTIHCGLVQPATRVVESSTTLLWTLRNPVDRAISWYHYTNPSHCQKKAHGDSKACAVNNTIYVNLQRSKPKLWATRFFECFPYLDMFAMGLTTTAPNDDKQNCTALAWKTVRGQTSMASNHLYFNHAFYWALTNMTTEGVPAEMMNDVYSTASGNGVDVSNHNFTKEVWVVRTEHLWDDLQGIERALASESNGTANSHMFRDFPNETHGSERHTSRTPLSAVGRQRLCCSLLPELELYVALIQRATNLAVQQRLETISDVMTSCWETTTTLQQLQRQCGMFYQSTA